MRNKESKPEDSSVKSSKKIKPYPILDEQEIIPLTTGKNKISYDSVKKGTYRFPSSAKE
ncbi:hypothetical protein Aconfl_07140 [Algoriphagus confluentis]|uniref:Uncharacterized protein n=1 Tax=Algoriphagus confluentis TaxID=1697556 RepID=A0ABQ6PJD6_9BACT|nr:hypothetical protein Aconfl_07140 [Algoriphagus confluentis]